jgi:hypothetical protein
MEAVIASCYRMLDALYHSEVWQPCATDSPITDRDASSKVKAFTITPDPEKARAKGWIDVPSDVR